MMRNLLLGVVAGATGTVALDVATYVDMALRGRPPSSVPAQLAGLLADKAGLPLATGGDDKADNRKSGLGALFGYALGLGVGAVYGLLRPSLGGLPAPLAAGGVGLAAMAAGDIPIGVSGVSNPATWDVSGWAADLVPHLVYGLVTAGVYDALSVGRTGAGADPHRDQTW